MGAPNFGHVMPLAPEPGFGFQYKCDIEDDPAFMQEKGRYTCTPRAFESERRTPHYLNTNFTRPDSASA